MNRFVLQAYILPPLTPGQDRAPATGRAGVPGYRQSDGSGTIGIAAYRSVAETLAPEQWFTLAGSMRLEKGALPLLTIDSATPSAEPSLLGDVVQSVNSVALVGRAGRDPEVRYFESGNVIAKFSLAVNRRSRDDEPDWFNLEIWGKQASVAADYVRKGSLLGVTGSFEFERWTDRATGEERSKPVIRVDRLDMLGSRRDAEQGGAGGDGQGWADGERSEEDVPF
jgi:single-strand DNA-binding protein